MTSTDTPTVTSRLERFAVRFSIPTIMVCVALLVIAYGALSVTSSKVADFSARNGAIAVAEIASLVDPAVASDDTAVVAVRDHKPTFPIVGDDGKLLSPFFTPMRVTGASGLVVVSMSVPHSYCLAFMADALQFASGVEAERADGSQLIVTGLGTADTACRAKAPVVTVTATKAAAHDYLVAQIQSTRDEHEAP